MLFTFKKKLYKGALRTAAAVAPWMMLKNF